MPYIRSGSWAILLIIGFNLMIIDKSFVEAICQDSDYWECDNGQCIDELERCNGVVQCSDGSDETAENCIHIRCPSFSFRCAYGACVVNKPCDGIKLCADNSDEMPLLCAENKQELLNQLHGNCSDDKFMCKSGECVEADLMCDGRLDCSDGSDEKVEICSANACPSYSFRCGYGACIRGTGRCDNFNDCADGSDEAAQLCGRERKKPIANTTTTTTTTTTSTTMRPILPILPPEADGEYCMIAAKNDYLLIYDVNNNNKLLFRGQKVRLHGLISYKCPAGFNLEYVGGGGFNFCESSGWNMPEPKCTRNCSIGSLTKGYSTLATCYFNNDLMSCTSGNSLRPGTEAKMRCAHGFVKPFVPSYPETLQCNEEGYWNKQRIPCQMTCGFKAEKLTAFSTGGVEVDVTDVPWNVGVYSIFNNKTYVLKCGGTIISPRLVLSAAHCFWDRPNSIIFPPEYYAIAAGKQLRDYYADETYTGVQKRHISEIVVTEGYDDLNENYVHDLAILILKEHLRFTESIRPVCLDFPDFAHQYVPSNLYGIFAGWGITENNLPADKLLSVVTKTLSHKECESTLNSSLATDKFCVMDDSGSSACQGDSGSGYVISMKNEKKKEFFILLGVISHAAVSSQNCAYNGLVALTNVRYYKNFIKKYIDKDIEEWL